MKAAILEKINEPWKIKEVPKPQPGPNQVLIKVKASGICYTDVHTSQGHIPIPLMSPHICGHEVAGEVVEVGAGVTNRKVGDRVGVVTVQGGCGRCEWCLRGHPTFCFQMLALGWTMAGGHAEYTVAMAERTVLLPDNVSYETAAPLMCAGFTAWAGIRAADPKPEQTIAVLGIGGIGHMAAQLSVAEGFKTIAISHTSDKDDLIYSLGVEKVVHDGKGLLQAGGADILLACGNSTPALLDAMQGIRPGGEIIVLGFDSAPLTLPLMMVIMRKLRVLGAKPDNPEHLYEVLQIAAAGKIKVVSELYGLDDIQTAYQRVAEGKVHFRAVVLPEKKSL